MQAVDLQLDWLRAFVAVVVSVRVVSMRHLELLERCDQPGNTRDLCTAMPAVTPSALAQVAVCAARVMSPAANTPATLVAFHSSVWMKCPNGPSCSSRGAPASTTHTLRRARAM